jgi:error-prone DNA polymerase
MEEGCQNPLPSGVKGSNALRQTGSPKPPLAGVGGWGVLGPTGGPQARPVRLGLNRVAGLSEAAALRICAARKQAPFASAEDLARRAQLDAGELKALAAADALQALAGHRHQAAWAVAGIDTRPTELLRHTRLHEPALTLPAPTLGQQVLADYRAMGLSLNQHPLALLRQRLQQHSIQPANVLASYPNGRLARASGLVTHRQRPETAKGVVFVTLEDETGQVNVIVWPAVADSQRIPLLNAKLLTVYGTWQKEGQVTHLIAQRLVDHTELLGGLAARSRDFR